MSNKKIKDLTKVSKEKIDSLILYHRKVDEIKRTRFFNFYKKNLVTTKIKFKLDLLPSIEIDNSN